MVSLSTFLLLGASILSASAQVTTAPPVTTTPAPTTPAATITAPPAISTPNIGNSPLPLTQYHFTYPNLPYQVNPFQGDRGPQSGYNICNSTTEGPTSLCQTLFINDITDFCLWGSPKPNGVIGDIEGDVVAYCTKPGHGTRLLPPGTLTAVQFLKAPGYIQLTGLYNQVNTDMAANDAGGELDPHGADLFGNPLGGLVFSNNLPTLKSNATYVQVNNWNSFVGGDQFCFKACDNTITSPDFCQNIYDIEGYDFNMPASYAPNLFTSCDSDNQAEAGDPNIAIPATSNCITYASTDLYPGPSTSTSSTATATVASSTGTTTSKSTSTSKSSAASRYSSGDGFFSVVSSIVVATIAGIYIVW